MKNSQSKIYKFFFNPWVIGFGVTIISGLVLYHGFGIGKSNVVQNTVSPETSSSQELVIKMVKFESPDKKIYFQYPIIDSGLTTDQITKFNEFTSESAKNIYSSQGGEIPDEWSSETTVIRSDYQIVSVRIDISEYFKGAAHGNHFTSVMNYSVNQSRGLNINDLFIENSRYLNRLSSITKSKIIDGYKKDGHWSEGFQRMVDDGTKPEVKSFSKFVIGKDYLLFIFDPYEVGPYSEGRKEVKVTFEELKDLLKPDLL